MDPLILLALAMLVFWGWLTFTTTAAGWVHLLLTFGVFLLIWRIVVRGTPGGPQGDDASATRPSPSGDRTKRSAR